LEIFIHRKVLEQLRFLLHLISQSGKVPVSNLASVFYLDAILNLNDNHSLLVVQMGHKWQAFLAQDSFVLACGHFKLSTTNKQTPHPQHARSIDS